MTMRWVKYVTWRDIALLLIGADLGSRVLRALRTISDTLVERLLQ